MQMRGLAVGHSCFVCYSGKAAKVYRVDMQLQRFDALEPVHTRYNTMQMVAMAFIVWGLFLLIAYNLWER